MREYEQLHVVVTGGAGALGRTVVDTLRGAGAICHVMDQGDAAGGGGVDLTDEDAVTRAYGALPPIWASIQLAGGFAMAPVVDTRLADLRAMHELNGVTCFLACREAVRSMRRGGRGGRIVNVAARPALVPAGGMIAYSASKAAVASITQSLAVEVAADRILVNAIAPSIIDTPANRRAMPSADFAKWPKAAAVAEAIAWLASPRNTLTSGVVLPVYGEA
jgi:NAD(P)-dependent dehydrogenase (short-subunit alcohol dehydrogenase family)